jgi:iron-sulfur cluster assembly protein
MSITVTEKAVDEIKRVMLEQNISQEENVLRVSCQGGGCSGFTYSLGFESKSEGDNLNDTVMNFYGLEVKLDNRLDSHLAGTTVDFHSDLSSRGFVFNNPNSSKGCGCGKSFGV